jgi:RNA polymerase sigma factor (sigma-70 family)
MPAELSPAPLLKAFQESYQDLVRFIARRTGNPQDARELAHDAWLRLAERADGTGAEAAPAARAYVYAVAENIAIDHLRRRQRGAERFAATDGSPPEPPDPHAADVAERLSHRQALDAVAHALQALPARSQAIFLADRLDGASHAELAAQHGISVKTVEREVMRAMDGVEAALHRWRGETAAPARRGRRRALSALLGLAGLTVGAGLWQAWRRRLPQFEAALATAVGRIQAHRLPDGSRLTLDAASRAEVAYFADRRQVRLLAGSAFFDVAHDAARPFTVQALGHAVTVLGTRFAVDLGADGLRVAVESGRVQLRSAGGATRVLGAGDSAHIDAAQQLRTSAGTTEVAPWRTGWLDFHHVPLGEAVARLARYSPRPLAVAPGAADLSVVGRVRIADASGWLRLLPGSLPVRVDGADRPDGPIVVTRR